MKTPLYTKRGFSLRDANYLAVFLAAGFFAGAFLAAGFAATSFFAAGFLAAGVALVAGFTAVICAAFLVASILTPAFLAVADSCDLRRAAVFFLIRPFLTAVSISL